MDRLVDIRKIRTLSVVLIVVMLVGIFYMRNQPQDKSSRQLEWILDNQEKIILPYRLEKGPHTITSISSARLKDISEGDCIAFMISRQNVKVVISGEERYSRYETVHPVDAYSEYVFVPLNPSDEGKTVEIQLENTHVRMPNLIYEVYLGKWDDIRNTIWKKHGIELILSVWLFLVGFLGTVTSFYHKESMEQSESLKYMGIMLVLLAIWTGVQTEIPQLLLGRNLLLLLAEELSVAIYPIVMAMAFRPLTYPMDFRKEYDSFILVCGSLLIAGLAANLTTDYTFSDTYIWGVLFTVVFVFYMAVFGFVEARSRFHYTETQKVLHSRQLTDLIMTVILNIILVIYYAFGGKVYSILLLAYLIGAVLAYMQLRQAMTLRQIQEELSISRMQLLMSQIKPHFLYNTLTSIRTLIRKDPDSADQLVYNFSHYLRSNMLLAGGDRMIPFSEELNHIKSYVNIECICYPKLNVLYEVSIHNFMVPALSIQPLVENAIKHGILKKVNGGTVVINTYETAHNYCIRIADTGVGFDPENVVSKPDSYGLKNVEMRLTRSCKAELIIESSPGNGCVVLVKIPKHKEDYDE